MNEGIAAYFKLLGSLLYNEPDAQAIETLKEGELFAELPFAEDNALALQGQRQMCAWLEEAPIDELTQQARSDYMRLLVGAGKESAPPWGSVYLDKDRLLFSENTLHVRQFYERYEVMAKSKYHEPDDHIGLELEFLAHLINRGELDAALDFAGEFILPWIDRWNADVQKHAKTDYYRALGTLAVGGVHVLVGDNR